VITVTEQLTIRCEKRVVIELDAVCADGEDHAFYAIQQIESLKNAIILMKMKLLVN
jgi:hypothetical protein